MNEQLITPRQLAEHLKVTMHTLYTWRSDGKGPRFLKIGNRIRYRESDVQDWIGSQNAHTKPSPPSA